LQITTNYFLKITIKSAKYFKYNAIVYIDLKIINYNKVTYSFKFLVIYSRHKITIIYDITLMFI